MARTPKVVEDRREQLIDAAMSVFSQKGFARATNKDIAREAGITPGLIYHYFASKEDLLMAVIEQRSPLQFIATLPTQALSLPPEQFFRFLLLRVLNIIEEEKFVRLLRVVLSEILHGDNPHMTQLAPYVIQRVLSFIGSYLEVKMESGEVRRADVPLVAQTLIGSVIGFVLRRQILRDEVALAYSHEQIVESVISVTLQGLLPR